MSSLSLLRTETATTIPAGQYTGKVARTSPLTVTIDTYDDRHEFSPCRLPVGTAPPAAGAEVLVIRPKGRDEWWVIPGA